MSAMPPPQPGQPQPYQNQPYPNQPYPNRPYPNQPGPQDPPPNEVGLPPQGQPAMGTLALTIQGSAMTSNMIVPRARFNGHLVPTRYGRQDIPVPAGPLHIDMDAQWMRTYGQAAIDVNVAPGQVVPVFYAAPYHQFTTGSIGHEQQSRNGVVGLVITIALIVLLIGVPMLAVAFMS
ncbi:MAG TPA: hypothetical protein IAA98_11270 [Candidatus Avipropionibacterium avicola]|uniref:Uncharacterized protein n=1 Tax=Candidatus Avipropionibacterium avicola TaxID=2840701 RepID=A0A9D1KNU0_9ACTN|nr:hypothetical protein [Candidatus Avipropionibacterium avicola]